MKEKITLLQRLFAAVFLLAAAAMQVSGQVTVTGATVGNGNYTTLKGAFDAINGGTQNGTADIVITISDNTTETASAVLNAGGWNSLKIYPTVSGKTISGDISGALIDLNGADKVTIDGRVNQSGSKDLTISNTYTTVATATQAIRLYNDASNNTIKYCTIRGRSIAATNGTVLVSTGTSTGNDNNTIDYCDIADGASMPACGVCFNGSTTYTNDGNTVSNCNIYNISSTVAQWVYGINVNSNSYNTTLNSNRIYWTSTISPTVAVHYAAIRTNSRSAVISNNIIGYSSNSGTGTATITSSDASRFLGIDANGVNTYPPILTNNIISDIQFTSTTGTSGVFTGVLSGIFINQGEVIIGTNSTDGNTIRNIKLITTAAYASATALCGISGYGASAVAIKYNKIYNLNHEPSGNFNAMVRGIQLGSTATATRSIAPIIVGNEIHDLSAGKSANSSAAEATGIANNVTGTALIDKNLIYNLVALRSSNDATVNGISATIQDNTGKTHTFQNNMISLGNTSTGGAIITGLNVGATQASPTAKFYYYHNSVYIGGSQAANGGSRAFNSAAANGATEMITVKNNIFVNMRTSSSAGIHYLVRSVATLANTASWIVLDKNLYKMPTAGTYNIFGNTSSGSYNELSNWKAANSALDPNSISGDPLYTDATNTTTPNLHIGATSPAKAAATDLSAIVGDDFDGDTRGGGALKQDIGADDISNAGVAVSIWKKTVPANNTYAYNVNLDFTVEYTKVVTVAGGTPYIPITLSNSNVVNANYISGSGTKTLTFRYTIGANVQSTGITVGDINLNGATIVNGSDNAPLTTNQTLSGVNIDATYGTTITAVATPVIPTNTSSTITYWTGAVLDYKVTFAEAVTVTGTPRIPITLTGGATVYANYYSGTGTSVLTFRYVVGTSDADGTITLGSDIDLNSGTIKQGMNMNSFLTLNNITPTDKTLVINNISNADRYLTFTAPANGTYGIGQNIDIVVGAFSTTGSTGALFNFAYTAGTTPYIPLTLDNGSVVNAYCVSGSGIISSSDTKTFRYTVTGSDVDADGIVIGNIELNGSTINYIYSAFQASQTVTFASSPIIKIANSSLPTVSVTSSTYGIGQTIQIKLAYSENITVAGTPSISVLVGATTKTANFISGSDTSNLTFGYTVISGDEDTDGISLVGQDITLNGGTLKNGSNIDINPTFAIGLTGTAIVANLDMPYITSVTYPTDGTYGTGANLDIYVTTNKVVTVTGNPYFPLGIESGNWPGAYYQSGSGTNTLKFRYTVASGVVNTTGVLIGNLVNLNGGTIKDATNNNMTLYKGNLTSSLPNVKLNGITPPSVVISSSLTSPTTTSPIPVTVTFSEAMNADFTVDDIVVSNGTKGTLTTSNNTIYTLNVTPTAAGVVTVSIPALSASATSNSIFNAASNTFNITLLEASTTISSNQSTSGLTLTPYSVLTVQPNVTLTVDANTNVYNLTIQGGGKLTVNNGYSITAVNLTLQSDATNGTATIKDLNANGGITVTGATSVQQYFTSGRNWYISSPLTAAKSTVFSATSTNPLYSYVEPNGSNASTRWAEITANAIDLVPTRGYIANMDATVMGNQSNLITFTGGSLNTGNITTGVNDVPALTRTTGVTAEGFNLVGNPYPSYLDWENLSKTNLMSTVWYRTKNPGTADPYVAPYYVFDTYGATAGEGTNLNGSGNVTALIPPMQAFWVRVSPNQTSGQIAFTNAVRSHREADKPNNKFRAPKASTNKVVRLQVSNSKVYDEALVVFNSAAANGFDDYDSQKKFNNVATMPEIYTKAGNEQLVINGLTEITNGLELPLGFTTGTAGDFSIKATELRNIDSNTKVYLRDIANNSETELTTESAYTFNSAVTANNESRFALIFRTAGVSTGVDNATKLNAQVYVNSNNQIVISAPEKSAYSIYNAMGQMIENGVIINTKHETRNTKFATGVYVVKVGNQSTRVIIK